jgi:ABC-type sugar transport system ATPase subunit
VGRKSTFARLLARPEAGALAGAKVLILDEPTAALGVKQSGVVLKYIIQARERGLAVIFITHNPHHAYPVGDRFLLLNRGASIGYFEKSQITREELTGLMAGGSELEQLSHELERRRSRPRAQGRSERARHQPEARQRRRPATRQRHRPATRQRCHPAADHRHVMLRRGEDHSGRAL